MGQAEQADSAQVNLDSLLIASVGGPDALKAIQNLKTIRIAGHVRLNDQEGTFTSIIVSPDKFYNELIFPGFTLAQGYNGSIAWRKNYNGKYTQITGYEKEELRKELYFDTFAFLDGDKANKTVSYRQRVILDNLPYHQVGFTPIDSLDTVYVYFSTENAEPRMMLSKFDNAVSMTYTTSFRTINNIKIPWDIRIVAPAAGLDVSSFTDSVTLNDSIPDSLFTPPDGSLTDYFFPSESTSVTIPLMYHEGHLFVEAKINGKQKAHFILDSGASTNIVSVKLAADASLPVTGTLPAKGISGFSSVNIVRIDSLSLGDITLFQQLGGCFDLAQFAPLTRDTTGYIGILGYDFLSHFPFHIDYQKQQLTLYNPAQFTAPTDGVVIPFDLSMLIPTVQAEVNGTVGNFLIDLGNPFGVLVHPYFAKTNGLIDSTQIVSDPSRSMSGVGGNVSGQAVMVDSFRIGTVVEHHLTVTCPAQSLGLTGSEALAGNIGNEFLNQFSLLFDYASSRLILYPASPR